MARAAGGSIRALVVSVRVRGTFGSPRTAMAGRFGGDGCGLVSPVDCFGRVRGGVECAGHVRQGTREVRLAYDLGLLAVDGAPLHCEAVGVAPPRLDEGRRPDHDHTGEDGQKLGVARLIDPRDGRERNAEDRGRDEPPSVEAIEGVV